MRDNINHPLGEAELIRGSGAGLGKFITKFPFEERTLLHVLAAQVEVRPDKDWLVFDSVEHLTFREAQSLSYRFAEAVKNQIGSAPRVALYLRNQLEFMPSFLGAQAAGGVAIPLNAELKGPLLEVMLKKSDAQLLVVRDELLEHLKALPSLGDVQLVIRSGRSNSAEDSINGVPVVTFEEFVDGVPAVVPELLPSPTDVGALMFTSGTSGGSKAAICTHHYLYWFPGCVADSLKLTDADIASTPLQICHVAAFHNLANASLHAGATAHLKTYFSANKYWEQIAADQATFSMLMGPMAGMIMHSVDRAPDHNLKHLYMIPRPVGHEEFENRYQTKVIWNGWGMTEIFPHLPTRERDDAVPEDTIGHAPTWVDFGVVDEDDRLLPPNVLGEMAYRPLIPFTMANGYYKDPEATAKAFRNFMFHTGDLGYYDEDGRVHFVMRNQDSIRRRGENISAVELERVALGHEAVLTAAAYAVPAEFGEHEVKLDVTCDRELDLSEFHTWLTENLPRYMVPMYLEIRDKMPMTVSQRVEKYKLMTERLDRPGVEKFVNKRR